MVPYRNDGDITLEDMEYDHNDRVYNRKYYTVNATKCMHAKIIIIFSLKWYYGQNIISFFSSNFESVFAKHLTGKILSFVFYPKAVYFECKFWISRSALLTFKTDR